MVALFLLYGCIFCGFALQYGIGDKRLKDAKDNGAPKKRTGLHADDHTKKSADKKDKKILVGTAQNLRMFLRKVARENIVDDENKKLPRKDDRQDRPKIYALYHQKHRHKRIAESDGRRVRRQERPDRKTKDNKKKTKVKGKEKQGQCVTENRSRFPTAETINQNDKQTDQCEKTDSHQLQPVKGHHIKRPPCPVDDKRQREKIEQDKKRIAQAYGHREIIK
ncbi:MAG: hypothetical protein Q8K65_05505 [Alphaproteobacteria bacterium]|nr:hypothetical protein [Alphaproteobacteria bacterium]